MLISFLIPSRNPNLLNRFFNYLESNTKNLSQIEVLIKLDNDKDYQKFIKNSKKRPFKIKFFVTPRLEGQPSLWFAVEKLFFECNKNSYFVQILSDEPYIVTKNWDEKLKSYKFFFKDSVFRLRTSKLKYFNYTNYFDCVTKPDSYPIYTRKWLELVIGPGNCWGSDAYQQLISYFLALGPLNYSNFTKMGSVSRDVPIHEIKYKGLEWGKNVSKENQEYMREYMVWEWHRLCSKENLLEISYKAMRIFLYLLAKDYGLKKFKIVRNGNLVKLLVKNSVYLNVSFSLSVFANYNIQKFALKLFYFKNFLKKIIRNYLFNNNFNVLLNKIFVEKLNLYKKKLIYLLRYINQHLKSTSNKFIQKKKFLNFNSQIFPTAPNLSTINKISQIYIYKRLKFNTSLPGMNFLKLYNNIQKPKSIPNVSVEDKRWFDRNSIRNEKDKKNLEKKFF
jgi:hypothetical protein